MVTLEKSFAARRAPAPREARVDRRPTDDRPTTDRRPTDDQPTTDRRPTRTCFAGNDLTFGALSRRAAHTDDDTRVGDADAPRARQPPTIMYSTASASVLAFFSSMPCHATRTVGGGDGGGGGGGGGASNRRIDERTVHDARCERR